MEMQLSIYKLYAKSSKRLSILYVWAGMSCSEIEWYGERWNAHRTFHSAAFPLFVGVSRYALIRHLCCTPATRQLPFEDQKRLRMKNGTWPILLRSSPVPLAPPFLPDFALCFIYFFIIIISLDCNPRVSLFWHLPSLSVANFCCNRPVVEQGQIMWGEGGVYYGMVSAYFEILTEHGCLLRPMRISAGADVIAILVELTPRGCNLLIFKVWPLSLTF